MGTPSTITVRRLGVATKPPGALVEHEHEEGGRTVFAGLWLTLNTAGAEHDGQSLPEVTGMVARSLSSTLTEARAGG